MNGKHFDKIIFGELAPWTLATRVAMLQAYHRQDEAASEIFSGCWIDEWPSSKGGNDMAECIPVGTRVRLADDAAEHGGIDRSDDWTGTVVIDDGSSIYPYRVRFDDAECTAEEAADVDHDCEHNYICVECFNAKQLTVIGNTKENIIMSVISKVRELAMSKEQKLRRKHGIVDECGNRTSTGTELMLDILFEANMAEIDKRLAAVEAEEVAEAKRNR